MPAKISYVRVAWMVVAIGKPARALAVLPSGELLVGATFVGQDVADLVHPATVAIVAKVPLLGKDLHQYSLETVKMFHDDARAAGFKLI